MKLAQRRRRKTIKQWQVETITRSLDEGVTTEAALRESWGADFDRLMRKICKRRREESAWASGQVCVTLYGRIVRETERAVLFEESITPGGLSDCYTRRGQTWWPKSLIQLHEHAMGPLDGVTAPLWLIREKYGATEIGLD